MVDKKILIIVKWYNSLVSLIESSQKTTWQEKVNRTNVPIYFPNVPPPNVPKYICHNDSL